MGGDFVQRVTELQEIVGHNQLVGTLERDQVYAHYQHAGINRFTGGPLVYHGGGQSHYQESALYDGASEYLQAIADTILEGGGTSAMKQAMEAFDGKASERCPKETGILSNSGHPTVTDNGALTYNRPPRVPRLSEAELRAAHPGGHKYGR